LTDPDITCAPELICFNTAKVASLRDGLPGQDDLDRLAGAFKAVAHPGRLAVLHLVAQEECCVCDLAHTLGLPISTASQHLRRLKQAGLLLSRQDGKLVLYRLADHAMVPFVTRYVSASRALDDANGNGAA